MSGDGRKASCGHEYLRAKCVGCEEHLTAVTGIPVRRAGCVPTLIPIGTRVRHWNHQYAAAYLHGTGTVVGYAEARDGTPEYMVERDEPILPGEPTLRQWPLNGTVAVTAPPGPQS